jgi:hypothetical protein
MCWIFLHYLQTIVPQHPMFHTGKRSLGHALLAKPLDIELKTEAPQTQSQTDNEI